MNSHEYEAQKRAIEEKMKYAQAAVGLQGDCMETKRPSLRERIGMDLRRANRESSKAGRLAELDALLDKHPEVARILELLEEVQG